MPIQTVRKLSRLPSFPAAALRILQQFENADVALGSVVEILKTDPALTSKLLRAANSAANARRTVTESRQAVQILGFRKAASLVLSFSLADDAIVPGPLIHVYRGVWLRSLIQAQAMDLIAREVLKGREAEAHTTGLMLDIGRLILLKTAPLEYKALEGDVCSCGDGGQRTNSRCDELSAVLIREWSLPVQFAQAVECRHLQLPQLRSITPSKDRTLIWAAALASVAADCLLGTSQPASLVRYHELGRQLFEWEAEGRERFLDLLFHAIKTKASYFQTDAGGLGSPSEMMSAALDRLAELAAIPEADCQMLTSIREENGRLKEEVQQLLKRTERDALTGCYNRGHFDRQLNQAFESCGVRELSLLFIDADHFKRVNDSYGHAGGDAVLKALARHVSETVGEAGIVARYGGEEFVIILLNDHSQQAATTAERIRSAVERGTVPFETTFIPVTVSIGIATVRQPWGDGCSELVKDAADKALYRAKAKGRNRVEHWRKHSS